MAIEKDEYTGTKTTGHEWDGIKELETPIPKAVIWSYAISIVICVLLWVLYPSFPGLSDFARGVLGYSSRSDVIKEVKAAATKKQTIETDLLSKTLDELAKDPAIKEKYMKSAAILFQDNCAACHGPHLKGQHSFPNLLDDQWLWSSDLEEIEATIKYGINSGHDEERTSEMLAFGQEEMLEKNEINSVVNYVLSLSKQEHNAALASEGAEVFAENCASCHGPKGVGGLGVGAPNLSDKTWIYGGDQRSIHASVFYGRKGVMPAWDQRLTASEIRKLVLYLKWKQDDETQ